MPINQLSEVPAPLPRIEVQPEAYGTTRERIYTKDHLQVLEWTRYFEEKTQALGIFEMFERNTPRGANRAAVVGTLWHEFSSFVPGFLCLAAARVSTNEKKHYVIQAAFEELGMRDVREIHSNMFAAAAEIMGVTKSLRDKILANRDSTSTNSILQNCLDQYSTDSEILGLLLGVEIPAIENIEAVFNSLAWNEESASLLAKHPFFIIHKAIELEHVRLTISNMLRFCPTPKERALFEKGVDDGLYFWSQFWNQADSLVRHASSIKCSDERK